MKKQINFKRKFGPNAPMPHSKFKERYFEIKLKSASASFVKAQT